MARIPEIIRRKNISQVAAKANTGSGFAWKAISDLAKVGEDVVRPAAVEQAKEDGLNSVYRDENGQLKVDNKSLLGGELAGAHNSAAYAKFLSQRSIDTGETMTELAIKYQFDPSGFKEASDLYVRSLEGEEGVPALLREDIASSARREASARFNGLYRSQVQRDQSEANRNSKTQRDMLSDDYINLVIGGDLEAAEEKYAELVRLSEFRADTAYISETPAETEAFLRGTRGAAKAAKLTQELSGLVGATSISDEQRKEIETLLSDPDIDPKTRQKLYMVTQGRMKGIDAAGIVAGLTDGSVEGRVISVESAGRANAKNPNSSAYGPHQFLKGTWASLVNKYKPEWANGLSEGQIQALRADRAKSSEMYQHFRRENQMALSNAGLPINPATEYMAHFFGAGGAVKLLKSDPSALVSDLVSADTISSNDFLKGMTVHDAKVWAARKMTMKASDMAQQQLVIDQIDDRELMALASKALSEQIAVRNRFEQFSAQEYETRMADADDTLTSQEILEDHNLSDEAQRKLVTQLEKANKSKIEIQKTLSELNNPDAFLDMADKKVSARVDDVYEASLGGANPLSDPEHISTAVQFTDRTGKAPTKMFNALVAGVRSDDPEEVAQAMEVANGLMQAHPSAFTNHAKSKELLNALSDYKTFAEFGDATTASSRMIEARKEVPKNVSKEADSLAENLDISDIVSFHDSSWFSDPTIGIDGQESVEHLMPDYVEEAMMGEYKTLFKKAFIETGDESRAKTRALDDLGRIYAPNTVTGNRRIMKYPPQLQAAYPPIDGSHDWMQTQIEKEISEHVFGDLARKGGQTNAGEYHKNWVEAKDIYLVSDAQTRRESTSNDKTSYQLFYMKDGVLEALPDRFFFDPSEFKKNDVPSDEKYMQHMRDLGRNYARENPGLFNPQTEIDRFERKAKE
jgi:hypothetical protein